MYDQTSAGRDREMDVGTTSYESTSRSDPDTGTDYTGTGTGYTAGTDSSAGTDYTGTGTQYVSGAATTQATTPQATGEGESGGIKDKAGTAARTGAQAASDTARDVAGTARTEAGHVASEAKTQARHVAGDIKEQIRGQIQQQQGTMVGKLRQASDEMHEMARSREQSPASSLVSNLADRTGRFADHLESRGAEGVLSDIQDFARRRPGTFLIAATAAGFVAGRVGKGIFSAQREGGQDRSYRDAYDAAAADTFAGFRGGSSASTPGGTGYESTYGSGTATGTAAVAGAETTSSGYATPTETSAAIRDEGDFSDPRSEAVIPGGTSAGSTEGGRP